MNLNKIYIVSVYVTILAFLSLNPWLHPDSNLAFGSITWDKIDHAVAYGLFSLLLMSMFHKQQWVFSLIVLLFCSFVGILIEYCQFWFTSTREFSYYDAIANVFGAVLGVALFWCCLFIVLKNTK